MLTQYIVGNLSLEDSTRVDDFLLEKPADSVVRPTTYQVPGSVYVKDYIIPDKHTKFSCDEDQYEYYTKPQMLSKLNIMAQNVQAHVDHVIPDHFEAVIE